jgi:hypothetical protein
MLSRRGHTKAKKRWGASKFSISAQLPFKATKLWSLPISLISQLPFLSKVSLPNIQKIIISFPRLVPSREARASCDNLPHLIKLIPMVSVYTDQFGLAGPVKK